MSRYGAFRKLLFRLDPERAHLLTLQMLALAGALPALRSGLRRIFSFEAPSLETNAFGLEFANPIGLAAGYDKDAVALRGLACLGFGHLELGTVTLEAQAGNPRPRLFRLTRDEALINRMGFPNQGIRSLLDRLKSRPTGVVLGINIGKSADTPIEEASRDYVRLMELAYDSADYLAVNVSSPNTVGLRELQGGRRLEALLADLSHTRARLSSESGRRRPVMVKLSPDLEISDLEQAVQVIRGAGMDGIILTNTIISRAGLLSSKRDEPGGLSGKPLFRRSVELVRRAREIVGSELPIIGAGGISAPEQAREMLNSGASLVQIYSGLVYRGPGLVREILQALA